MTEGTQPQLWHWARSDQQQRQHVSWHARRLHNMMRKNVSGATSMACHRNKRQEQCSMIARVLDTFKLRNRKFLQRIRWSCHAAIGHDVKVLCTNDIISGKKRDITLNSSVAMFPRLEEKARYMLGVPVLCECQDSKRKQRSNTSPN